ALIGARYSSESSSYSSSSYDYSNVPSSTSAMQYQDLKMPPLSTANCEGGTHLIADGNALECVRTDGVRDGAYQELDSTGNVRIDGAYFDGNPSGLWLYYGSDGR